MARQALSLAFDHLLLSTTFAIMNIIVRISVHLLLWNEFHEDVQETLFGRTVTPAERLRQHQRALAKAQRELDRERTKLEQQEKKLIMDIKKSAKSGQMVRPSPRADILVRAAQASAHRTLVKSWPRTSFALVDMFRSFTR